MFWSKTNTKRPPVDWDENARLFGGQKEMGERLVRRFVELNATVVEEMRAAVAAREPDTVRALAHKIKGGSGSVGAMSLWESAAAVEQATAGGAPWAQVEEALSLMFADWNTLAETHGD